MRQSIPGQSAPRLLFVFLCGALAVGVSCGGDEESRSYTVSVTCNPSELFSDGSDSSTCTVQVLDQRRQPAPSGTSVRFVSTILGTATPSGGFGSSVAATSERFLGQAGSAQVDFRCTGVGSIAIIAAGPDGARGADQVDCIEITGDWVIEDVFAESPGLRPGDSTEVCALALTSDGLPVTPGTLLVFTHDGDNGGFGSSLADSRQSQTGGIGEACVVYVAEDGNYREEVTITAGFANTSFGESTNSTRIIVDADLPENEVRCSVSPDTLLANGSDRAVIDCSAFGVGSSTASNVDIVCTASGTGAVSLQNEGVATTDSGGLATLNVTAGTNSGEAEITCEADSLGPDSADSVDLDVITIGEIAFLSTSRQTLGVSGTTVDDATVCFQINDDRGRPFPAGLSVEFDASGSTSSGVSLDADGTTDENGQVCTDVQAGARAGIAVINIRAQVTSPETATTELRVRGVVPSRRGMTLSCDQRNIGALRHAQGDEIREPLTGDLCTTCTLRLRDAADNDVGFPRTVTFVAESGRLPNGTTENDVDGLARATWCADGTLPADVDPFDDEPSWIDADGFTRNPRDGLVSIIAYVRGEEEWVDLNPEDGPGYNPLNDDHWDMTEPFVDANDNNAFDQSIDQHIDINDNGFFEAGNLIWDDDTTIWVQTRILVTGAPYFDETDDTDVVVNDPDIIGTDDNRPDAMAFDADYPDPARLSHWFVQDTSPEGGNTVNRYQPNPDARPEARCDSRGAEHCWIPSGTWFNGTTDLLVTYVMRDENGNPMNNSISGVSWSFDRADCNGLIDVEMLEYDPGLASNGPFPFVFSISREGGAGMDYSVSISEFTTGSTQQFSLTPGDGAAQYPDRGCRFQMVLPMQACSGCGDPADTSPWPFFVIND